MMDPGITLLLVVLGSIIFGGLGMILVAWAMSRFTRPPW